MLEWADVVLVVSFTIELCWSVLRQVGWFVVMLHSQSGDVLGRGLIVWGVWVVCLGCMCYCVGGCGGVCVCLCVLVFVCVFVWVCV